MKYNAKFLRMPLHQTALFLGIMAVAAVGTQVIQTTNLDARLLKIFVLFLATVGVATILFYALVQLTGKRKEYLNTLIASVILFLILAPPVNMVEAGFVLLATTITMLIKFFGTIHGKPLVNPVAGGAFFALAIAALLVPESYFAADWWGASFWQIYEIGEIQIRLSLILLALWVVLGLAKWRRQRAFFAFLATAITCQIFFAFLATDVDRRLDFLLYYFFDSTIYFFAAIMLIEPKTSPTSGNQQLVYGALVAALFAVLHSHSILGLPDILSFFYFLPMLTALIVGNLVFFFWAQYQALQKAKRSEAGANNPSSESE